MEMVMSVKNTITNRWERARLFADNARTVYEAAYNKALDVRKGGVRELVNDIQPRVRAVVEDRLHGAQIALDEFNQSLADKAVPAFRKKAVSKEQLGQKSEQTESQINKDKK